jgi:hypothetical protein
MQKLRDVNKKLQERILIMKENEEELSTRIEVAEEEY